MPRRRRRIESNSCYELCFRAREGLPLVAYDLIELIIGSAVSRTQRDNKVILCHDLWNGSHPHIIVVTKDSEQCLRFYGEIQKRLTDSIKRLLGLNFLNLWEGTAMVSRIYDLDAAIERIAYLYANPAKDNLEDCIEKFPGYTSWRGYKKAQPTLEAENSEEFPWIRMPSIPEVPDRPLTPYEDRSISRSLKESNKQRHILTRRPNAWMACFGIESPEEISEINARILNRVREKEEEARKLRKGKVMGAHRLRSQKILQPHKPKKKSRKIFIICSINKLRMELIAEFKDFCAKCRDCLRRWRGGDFNVEWPPGAFKPPLPPLVNVLPY